MSLMHDHQTALRDRAESLTVAFGEVQAQVLELKSGMLEFANTQNDTMSSFKVEMETARALATAFGESVSSLNIVRVFSILDSFWFVLQGLGLFAVMVVVNWLAGKTAARVVAVTCGCRILYESVSDHADIKSLRLGYHHYRSRQQTGCWSHLGSFNHRTAATWVTIFPHLARRILHLWHYTILPAHHLVNATQTRGNNLTAVNTRKAASTTSGER